MAKKRLRKMDRKLTEPDKPTRSRPRQQDLPGTDDRAIQALEEAAADYAELRDERMTLTQRETELKGTLLLLMKKIHAHKTRGPFTASLEGAR